MTTVKTAPVQPDTARWKDDAREFGLHVKQGGWRLGLLVARNVQPGIGEGRPPKTVATTTVSDKVSARAFAEAAGTSADRVLRYLAAWERAADKGHVPHAADLTPDTEPKLDVEDKLLVWEHFYQSPVGQNVQPGRQDALRDQAQRDGTGASKVVDVASNPKAMTTAIRADPPTAKAATEALTSTPALAEQTYQAARQALIEQARQELPPPPPNGKPKDERIIRIEAILDGVLEDLGKLLHPEIDPIGQRLTLLTDNLDALSEIKRDYLVRALTSLGTRVNVWEDRARGIAGRTVAG